MHFSSSVTCAGLVLCLAAAPGCQQAQEAGRFTIRFEWGEQGPPLAVDYPDGLWGWARVEQRTGEEPLSWLRLAESPLAQFGFIEGTKLSLDRVPNGEDLVVVVVLATEESKEGRPAYFGESDRFELAHGEDLEVPVHMALQPTPDGPGTVAPEGVLSVLEGEDSDGFVDSPLVTLAFYAENATRVIAANDLSFSLGAIERSLSQMPRDDRYLWRDYDLDAGVCSRPPCDGVRQVFLKLVNEQGYESPVYSVRLTLDTRAPSLFPGSAVSPGLAGVGSTVVVTVAPSEPLSAPPVLNVFPLDPGFFFAEQLGRSFYFSYVVDQAALDDQSYTFTVDLTDLAGNEVLAQPIEGSVRIDITPPFLSESHASPPSVRHDQTFEIDLVASEELGTPPLVRVGTVALPGTACLPKEGNPLCYTCIHRAQHQEGDGLKAITVELRDVAGNRAQAPAGEINYDVTTPRLLSSSFTPAFANASSTIALNLMFSEEVELELAATHTQLHFAELEFTLVETDGRHFLLDHQVTEDDIDGRYQLWVGARDLAGNRAAPETIGVLHLDNTAPSTTITQRPDPETDSESARFEFDCAPEEEDCSYACQLDSGQRIDCASGQEYAGLAQGDHRFMVTATDQAGNRGPIQVVEWRVNQCLGHQDGEPCLVVTEPDRDHDICLAGVCISPGCGTAACNLAGPYFALPDTNQLRCHDDLGEAQCLGVAGSATCATAPYCGQDAQYGWDTTEASGTRFDRDTDVADEPVVQDTVTGLMWQGCVAGQGGSDCASGAAEQQGWQTAVEYCDALAWGGLDDWHLPDYHELISLADFGADPPWPESFPASLDECCWTSSTHARRPVEGWLVTNGLAWSRDKSGHLSGARCVRVGQTTVPTPEGGRFLVDTDVADEPVVLDQVTELVWQGCPAGRMGADCSADDPGRPDPEHGWRGALAYCEALEWGGRSHWRLPNLHELSSIVDIRRSWPVIDEEAFPATPAQEFWSSTYSGEHASPLGVEFGNGYQYYLYTGGRTNVRCVHASSSPEFCTGPLSFTDPNLELVIRETAEIPTGDIDYDHVDGITVLDASNREITDLSGIECLSSLVTIRAERNQLEDIRPLAELRFLTVIEIYSNDVVDLAPLAGLTRLRELNASGNQVASAGALANLAGLEKLVLTGNQISDITWASSLASLRFLTISNNPITDLGPLSTMVDLEMLQVGSVMATDFSPITALTSLRSLAIDSNDLDDLDFLSELTLLSSFWASNCSISDFNIFGGYDHFRYLHLSGNQIVEIGALADNTVLVTLSMNGNSVSDLTPLQNNLDLARLNLRNNDVSDLGPLVANGGIGQGDEVDIWGNPIDCTEQADNIAELRTREVVLTTNCP